MDITIAKVDAAAPDPTSEKAGKGLAIISKWDNIGLNDYAIWGECKGSGSNPYKSQIDLRDFSFKCTCPSRKFPCKHGLGLLYLYIENKDKFNSVMPSWVEERIKSRNIKIQKEDTVPEVKNTDSEKRLKTEQKRISDVNNGLDDLEIWIQDFIRRGFESIKGESYSFFNQMASRMVDYKAPGIAKKIKELSYLSSSGKHNDLLLSKISKLYLLIKSFRNIENLPVLIQEDIKTQIGFTKNQDELQKLQSVKDTWFILGCLLEEEDNLKTKKIFLFGLENKKFAIILDFAISTKPFIHDDLIAGKSFKGDVIFYPSNLELRAIIKNKIFINNKNINDYVPEMSIDDIYSHYSESLIKNPFIEKIPCFTKNIYFYIKAQNDAIIFDDDNNFIPINKKFNSIFEAQIFSDTDKISLFGEFNGKDFFPVFAFNSNEYNFFSGHKNI